MKKKLSISICLGSSCFSRGNNENLDIILNYIKTNQLEADIDFQGCLCTGNCTEGPLLTINEKTYTKVDPTTVIDILNHVVNEQIR